MTRPTTVFAALVALATGAPTSGQTDDAAGKWDEAVAKAHEHRRFALRRAAAGKVARAGDEAVPALRAWAADRGRNAVNLLVVDAIARATTAGEAVTALLIEWSTDRTFYWRSQALDGLARRGVATQLEQFRTATDDPSHLFRIAGARGLLAVGDADGDVERVLALLDDPDPRVRLRVGILLLERDDPRGLPTVLDAIGRDDEFLGDPWGTRDATLATKSLRTFAETDFGLGEAEEAAAREAAVQKATRWAEERTPRPWPAPRRGPTIETAGGLEIRSCRHGDLFLRWTDDGRLVVGLDDGDSLTIPIDVWNPLQEAAVAISDSATHGPVICDFVRFRSANGHQKAAPMQVPPNLADWLKRLLATLEESDRKDVGRALAARLPQFLGTESRK